MKNANPFGTAAMAAGYARWRPPVHGIVLERVRQRLALPRPVRFGVDVGCGAGLSTRALRFMAEICIGIEPVEAMLTGSRAVAPECHFVAGRAEQLPLVDRSADMITAAGSLNYVTDLDVFFREAARVLTREGSLVVYDFTTGREFIDAGGLTEWFEERFQRQFPPPRSEARPLNPRILSTLDAEFRLTADEQMRIPLRLSREFYLSYLLTETNVAAAIRQGVPEKEIRAWCDDSLAVVWASGDREVLFRAYYAVLMCENVQRQ